VTDQPVRAAGGVVVRRGRDGPLELVVVHRPKYDDWTLPKGKLLPGEDEFHAAVRELEEETGLRCILGPEVGIVEYVANGSPKTARFWLAVAPEGDLAPTDEIDEARWVPVGDAAEVVSYDRDRQVVRRAAELVRSRPEVVPVALVRHASARDRKRWRGRDELRPLTLSGRRQADGLVEALCVQRPAALVSSRYLRCLQTFEPLAAAVGLPVQEHVALAEGAPMSKAVELLRAVVLLGPVALSTHGDVQPGVIERLAASGMRVEGPLRYAKGSVWRIEFHGDEPVAARYHPPPS